MYVCICNALTDRKLAEAAGDDGCNVAEVFQRCGTRPQCGKCLQNVAQIIDDARSELPAKKLAAE